MTMVKAGMDDSTAACQGMLMGMHGNVVIHTWR